MQIDLNRKDPQMYYTLMLHRDYGADEDFEFETESAALAFMDEAIRDNDTRRLYLLDEEGRTVEEWSRS